MLSFPAGFSAQFLLQSDSTFFFPIFFVLFASLRPGSPSDVAFHRFDTAAVLPLRVAYLYDPKIAVYQLPSPVLSLSPSCFCCVL